MSDLEERMTEPHPQERDIDSLIRQLRTNQTAKYLCGLAADALDRLRAQPSPREVDVERIAQIIDCDIPAMVGTNLSELSPNSWKEHRREHFLRMAQNAVAALSPTQKGEKG